MGFREVIMRVTASIKTTSSAVIDGTTITSNAVSFKHMAAYCNVPTKGTLYVIGSFVVGLSLLLQIRKALLRAAGILLKQKLVVMYSKVLLVKRRFLQAI